jgi:hypothetical protein
MEQGCLNNVAVYILIILSVSFLRDIFVSYDKCDATNALNLHVVDLLRFGKTFP